ncbi:alpha-ketoglutarate-dependent dioxygenase alkB homolog 7, mitochondrial [Episyrphus balteatus]|uniref:alpha-ketoglutarate-dependent dioxygenase alkB homolog 7, mitochondrial n=1 Tax=Episyrphus balteatus TaxID=286459 RepID=UPI0024864FB3|nr:alpha-ketoglutarate-dependent dioxygenase alkB homolog 7, mitochondrial [Episyrphus balteatus]
MTTLTFKNTNFIKNIILSSKLILKNKLQNANAAKYLSTALNTNEAVGNQFIEFHGIWPEKEQADFLKHMRLIPDFITIEEEQKLFEEIEPYMKRLRYEFDHWDDAIHGFRETERKNWYPHNREIIERVRSTAFVGEIMQYVHVLDLDEKGVIKPHVDSTRYCGTTISGMSMLSDAVMRLVRTDEKKYQQGNSVQNDSNDDEYRNQPTTVLKGNFYADILLSQRSLYIMSHSARYNFTHEILSNENSNFKGSPVKKGRRISIICRNDP